MTRLTAYFALAVAYLFFMVLAAPAQAQTAPVHNIVLMHGAFVTGAGMAARLRDS
jgi:hypothetical protein